MAAVAGSWSVVSKAPAVGRWPAPPVRLGRLSRLGWGALAMVGLLGAIIEGAHGLAPQRSAGDAAVSQAMAASHWVEIRHPLALYGLSGSEFARLPATYRAERHEPDGAREDVLTFGRPGGPSLLLSILRDGSEAAADGRSAADALDRLAAADGRTITRLRSSTEVETRLGRFHMADLLLSEGDVAFPCLGFQGGSGVISIAGLACGAPARPMDRRTLACVLDRVDLVSSGDDAALRAVFVAAERRADPPCARRPGPDRIARPAGWLDPEGEPPRLRGAFGVSARQR